MTLTTVQVVQQMSPGGIETMALDLQRFAPDPDNSFIISLQGNKDELIRRWPRLQERADQLICLEKTDGLSWQTIKDLAALLKKLNADVVHTHHIGPLLYGGIAARKAKVKALVHTEHDAWHLQSAKRRLLERGLLTLVKPSLVADAQIVANELSDKLKVRNPQIILNGIDTQRFQPGDKAAARAKYGIPLEAIIIGCAARLIAVKGHKILLAAMKQLPAPVHLVLAGHGEEEATLKQYVKDHLDGERIHFLGNVDDMPTFYQALDVFCLPSYKEGFPLSPLEAQSAGVSVVASDTGGMKETLYPKTGRLVPPGDPQLLADALNAMIKQLFGSALDEKSIADGKLAGLVLNTQGTQGTDDTATEIRTLQQATRDFVVTNNDVRQMANHYHHLYRPST